MPASHPTPWCVNSQKHLTRPRAAEIRTVLSPACTALHCWRQCSSRWVVESRFVSLPGAYKCQHLSKNTRTDWRRHDDNLKKKDWLRVAAPFLKRVNAQCMKNRYNFKVKPLNPCSAIATPIAGMVWNKCTYGGVWACICTNATFGRNESREWGN